MTSVLGSLDVLQVLGNVDGNDNEPPESCPQYIRKISEDGICGNCSAENASDDSVCCLFCKTSFHALCFAVKENKKEFFQDNSCTRSFLNGLNQGMVNKSKNKRFGSFVFVCDFCLTKHENNVKCKTNDRVSILDNRVTNLADDVTEIKKLLKEAISRDKSPAQNVLEPLETGIQNTASNQPEPDNMWSDKDRVKSLLVVAKDANVENATLEKTVVDNMASKFKRNM